MLSQIGTFILFLSPLVFFHELGHFLMARFFGVRVEVFSIGFGPKLFKFKKGFTEYAFSLIPLGGYVKMFGDDPFAKESIPESERHFSFVHQAKWPKFCIVSAGPIANFILAFALFFSLLMSGEKLPEIRIGEIKRDAAVYKMGIRTGDVLISINDVIISGPTDIVPLEKESLKKITVRRKNKKIELPIGMNAKAFFDELLKYLRPLVSPILVDSNGKYFGVSTHSEEMDWQVSLPEIIVSEHPQRLYIHYLSSDLSEYADQKKSKVKKFAELEISEHNGLPLIYSMGLYPADLLVKAVRANSPAEVAGVVAGDIIVEIDGKMLASFEDLRSTLQESTKEAVSIGVLHKGQKAVYQVTPTTQKQDGRIVKIIGIESTISFVASGMMQTESKGFFNSVIQAAMMTVNEIGKTITFVVELISGNISMKNVGGPIAISSVAANSFNFSLTYFFRIMAMMSVNLGIINLFPIPVLDGGHLMFITIELIKRSPLSKRTMEMAQQFGLSLLLLLMVVVFYNDLSQLKFFAILFN